MSTARLKMPIGLSDFRQVIKEGYFFADEIDTALQKAADEALQQMENKAYDTEAKQQRHHILKIAINISKTTIT